MITCFPSYPEFSRQRVCMQNPEGAAQMDDPEEATQESALPLATLQPRKRGHPRFRGSLDEICYVVSWESCTETLLPISPINTPAEQQRGASKD